jgi:D-arabinono-1,4-lactone oxidase
VIEGVDWRGGAFHANTVEDVQRVVTFARDHGRRVRAAGAQHSTTPAVYSPDHSDLRVILDGSLRHVDFLSEDDSSAVVQVGGGCYLGVNPADPSSNRANSLDDQLEARGFALPILGGISHQTIAGFLQTSSSGGSLQYGFADAVKAIELVDGTGEVRWLNVSSDAFHAAAVSCGLFGVITHVVLACGRRYFVTGTETNHDEGESLLKPPQQGHYELEAALSDIEYLHLNWFPQRRVKRVTQWIGTRNMPTGNPDPYESELKSTWMNVLAAFVLLITSGVLAIDPNGPIAERIVGHLLRKFVPLDKNETFNDQWLTVLPGDDQVKVDTLIKIIFTEIWLPLDQLTNALDRLKEILQNQAVAGNFAVELYGARRSPFWLSPSYDRDSVRVDVFWWAYSFGDPRQHFTAFWNALLDLQGARLHWGKHLPEVDQKYGNVVFNPDLLKKRYPRLDDWLTLRHDSDPDAVFVTDYWRTILGI